MIVLANVIPDVFMRTYFSAMFVVPSGAFRMKVLDLLQQFFGVVSRCF